VSTFVIKRGDLLPSLTATLTDDDVPVDLSTAESVNAVGVRRGVVVFDRAVDVDPDQENDGTGMVSMEWEEGDTDALGYISVEFVVTWPGGARQTFPHDGFERVRVALGSPAAAVEE
jgi:hypothetical protein